MLCYLCACFVAYGWYWCLTGGCLFWDFAFIFVCVCLGIVFAFNN